MHFALLLFFGQFFYHLNQVFQSEHKTVVRPRISRGFRINISVRSVSEVDDSNINLTQTVVQTVVDDEQGASEETIGI